jgi:hypothetical protein
MTLAKKIFITSASLLALVLILWGVYFLAFQPKNVSFNPDIVETDVDVEVEKPIDLIPEKNENNKIYSISTDPVTAPTIDERGTGINYYSRDNGRCYNIDFDGTNKKAIINEDQDGLIDAFWSPDKKRVISKFLIKDKIKFFYYDFTTRKNMELKDNIDSLNWQNNNRILYKYYDTVSQKRILTAADPDGSNWKDIAEIFYRNVSIQAIPQSSLISFWNEPDALTSTTLQSIPIFGGEVKTIFKDKFGTDYLWSPDGSKLLISHLNEKQGKTFQLAVANEQGGEYQPLQIPTFISKCAWSADGKYVYFALPLSIPENVLLPNDYNARKFTTADTFWKVEVATGKKSRLIETKDIIGNYDATKLFLNKTESVLFFINRLDNKLYRLDLK